jgi:predicted XRE-type DNA-binding protein
MSGKIDFRESTGNVFADLGLDDAEELHTRGKIGFYIVELLKNKNMKQREISGLLGIKQAEVLHLSRFTDDKLLDFLERIQDRPIK